VEPVDGDEDVEAEERRQEDIDENDQPYGEDTARLNHMYVIFLLIFCSFFSSAFRGTVNMA